MHGIYVATYNYIFPECMEYVSQHVITCLKLARYTSTDRLFLRKYSLVRHELQFVGIDPSAIEAIGRQVVATSMYSVGTTWTTHSIFFWICKWVVTLHLVIMLGIMIFRSHFLAFNFRAHRTVVVVATVGLIIGTACYIIWLSIEAAMCGWRIVQIVQIVQIILASVLLVYQFWKGRLSLKEKATVVIVILASIAVFYFVPLRTSDHHFEIILDEDPIDSHQAMKRATARATASYFKDIGDITEGGIKLPFFDHVN